MLWLQIRSPNPSEKLEAIEEERSKWDQFLEKTLTTTPLDTRAFRAGVIFSPLRGLSVTENGLYESDPPPVETSHISDGKTQKFKQCTGFLI